MTEEQWLTGSNPALMLAYMRGRADDRLFRLVACACCRRTWRLLTNQRSRDAIVAAEAFADGRGDDETRRETMRAASQVTELRSCSERADAAEAAAAVLRGKATYAANKCGTHCARALAIAAWGQPLLAVDPYWEDDDPHIQAEVTVQASIVRDIFGNPFRLPYWSPRDNGLADIVRLCEDMYESRKFDQMPVLADLLSKADCCDSVLLDHCRKRMEHFRGCWVVDVILGKR